MSSCMLSAYAALKDVDQATSNNHIDKGFQYALAKWWQVCNTPVEMVHLAGRSVGCLSLREFMNHVGLLHGQHQ